MPTTITSEGITFTDTSTLTSANILPTQTGNTGKFLTTNGSTASWENSVNIQSPTNVAAGLNSTTLEFSVPSGTNRITLLYTKLSTTAVTTNGVQIQLGTSSGYVISNYSGSCSLMGQGIITTDYTTGLRISYQNAATPSISAHGVVSFNHFGNNYWMCNGSAAFGGSSGYTALYASSVKLPSELTNVRFVTVNSSDKFDDGLLNISYE